MSSKKKLSKSMKPLGCMKAFCSVIFRWVESSIWPNAVCARNVSHRDRRPNQYSRFCVDPCRRNDPTIIGDDCSITHHATLHGCKLGDKCLVGINSTIMDGAVIGNNCIVAGHSIVTEGSNFPDNSIIAGSPAKLLKTRDSSVANKTNADFYVLNAKN